MSSTPISTSFCSLILIFLLASKPAGEHGNCPLHLAAAYQQSTQAIQVLIDANDEIINVKNNAGNCPLGNCILYNDNLEVMSMLVKLSQPDTMDSELFNRHENFCDVRTRFSTNDRSQLHRTSLHCVILRRAPW